MPDVMADVARATGAGGGLDGVAHPFGPAAIRAPRRARNVHDADRGHAITDRRVAKKCTVDDNSLSWSARRYQEHPVGGEIRLEAAGSRLGREATETADALKQLVRAGVRVFFYLEDRERTPAVLRLSWRLQ